MNDLPETGFIDANGLNIFYRRAGQGHPMILVHGWGATAQSNWVDTGWLELLARYRTVIAIDVRGHGRSDKPHARKPYGYAALCADVLAVLDAHGIEKCDFMGYSMGAFMGAYLLGHHVQRFSAMVLGGIGDETPESAAQGDVIAAALRASSLGAVSDPMGRRVREFVVADPSNDLDALAYSAQEMWPQGYPLRLLGNNASAAKLPVLIVNGSEDRPYVDSADRFAQALASGIHLRIPGVNHLSAVADERFKSVVVDFLARSSRVPSLDSAR